MSDTKPRWTPTIDDCVRAFYRAAQEADTIQGIAKLLRKEFRPWTNRSPELGKHHLIGALHRPNLPAALRRLYPSEADALLDKFSKKAVRTAASCRRGPKMKVVARTSVPSLPASPPARPQAEELAPVVRGNGTHVTVLDVSDKECKFPIGNPGEEGFGPKYQKVLAALAEYPRKKPWNGDFSYT